jgi:hypothetical protein
MTQVVVDLIKLLFGQVGVIGTLCLAVAAWFAYSYREEREAHLKTQSRYEDMNEKRFEVLKSNQETLTMLKDAISILANKVKVDH